MIHERFLQSAISIKRAHIKLIGDLDKYQKMAESTLRALQKAMGEMDRIERRAEEARKQKNPDENSAESILKVLSNIEEEGEKIENFIAPINDEIEKLAMEEQILYEKICEAHPDLDEETIVYVVSARLKHEGLM
jgi:hypothetical protein